MLFQTELRTNVDGFLFHFLKYRGPAKTAYRPGGIRTRFLLGKSQRLFQVELRTNVAGIHASQLGPNDGGQGGNDRHSVIGPVGVEPTLRGCKPRVLPLNYRPVVPGHPRNLVGLVKCLACPANPIGWRKCSDR